MIRVRSTSRVDPLGGKIGKLSAESSWATPCKYVEKNPLGSYFGVSTRLERRGNVRHGEGARLKKAALSRVSGWLLLQTGCTHAQRHTDTHALPWLLKAVVPGGHTAQRLANDSHPSEAPISLDFVFSWQIHFLNHTPASPLPVCQAVLSKQQVAEKSEDPFRCL